MDDKKSSDDRRCELCDNLTMRPAPYGSVDYFCERRRQVVPRADLEDGDCPLFER